MQAGKFVSASEINENLNADFFPCYGGNGLRGYIKSFNHDGKFALIGRQGALCGNVTLANGKFHATEHAVVATANIDMDTAWMFYLLMYLNLNQYATGMAQPGLSVQNLERIEATVPKTVQEQQKISSFLSLIDNRIQTQSKIIEGLKVLKGALSRKLFSQLLRFKSSHGNNFSDWTVSRLSEVCEIIGGGTPETNNTKYWNGNIQWFTPTEIKTNFVSKSERTITELGLKNSSAKILPKGTILLTTRATIGEVAITLEECATNQGFQSLVAKDGYNNIFLFNWIKENKYELIKRASGSTFPEISKSEIEKIKVNIPSFSEQTLIADFLSSLDNRMATEMSLLLHLEKQKKYLLQNLFI